MHGSWFTLAVMLILTGIGWVLLIPFVLAQLLLRPPRMTDGKAAWVLKRLSPTHLGLAFSEMNFSIVDEQNGRKLHIAGWWMDGAVSNRSAQTSPTGPFDAPDASHPRAQLISRTSPGGENGRCIVLLHGYADAKVGAIAWAPLFHRLGWNVLAIDLRAHGESGGQFSTAGFFERHDVARVISQLQAQRPDQTRQIVLFGTSLGASVAAAVAAMEPLGIAGAILECPAPSYRVAATSLFNLWGGPAGLLQRLAYRWAQDLSQADFTTVEAVKTLPQIRCPLMVIQSTDDVFYSPANLDAVEAAARSRPTDSGPLDYWRVEGAHHLTAIYHDPVEYERRISAFLLHCPL